MTQFIEHYRQGILLAYLLGTRTKLNKIARQSLATSVLVFSIMLLFWVGFWNDLANHNMLYDLLYYPIPFLLGPSFYDYVYHAIHEHSKRSSLHLIPSIITLLYASIASIYWWHTDTLLLEKDLSDFIIYQLHTISFLIYSALSFKVIQKKSNIFQSRLPHLSSLELVHIAVLCFGLFSIFSFSNYFFNRVLEIAIFLDLGLAIVSCIFIYSIGYLGLKLG